MNHAQKSFLLLRMAFLLMLASAPGLAQSVLRAIPNHTAYDVGSTVFARFMLPRGSATARIEVAIEYAGSKHPLFGPVKVAQVRLNPKIATVTKYLPIWKIPSAAVTGRYLIVSSLIGAKAIEMPSAGSFAVYRKLVRISRIHLNGVFFTSGEPVNCRVEISNLTGRPLTGLRVEFSDRYWPWIAGPAAKAASTVVPLATSLTLAPGASRVLSRQSVAIAPKVKKPSIHQYGVVVWDRAHRTVLDIRFSRLVFVNPPGIEEPRPYPDQYVYPTLKLPKFTAIRHFYPPSHNPAIRFDASHTLYPLASRARVRFTIQNPIAQIWRDVSVRGSLLDAAGKSLQTQSIATSRDFEPGKKTPAESVQFNLPDTAGLYRARIEVVDAAGNVLAANTLELGVNPLPASILLFGAHEDDEGDYMGLARAAIENHIPIHFVYLTSGDAGSCDMYYERSCGPAEALRFGALRMDEARAALGHLGIPPSDILFLGLPDGGSGEIWYAHPSTAHPFLDPLLSTDHAPFRGLVEPNLPYARDAVVSVVEQLIERYHPSVVVTEHPPSQRHIDHIVAGYVVIRALDELLSAGKLNPRPEVLTDRVYNPKTVPPTPYHYSPLDFYVSGEVAALAQESEWYYQSQGGNRFEGRLRPFDKLSRVERYRKILDWNEHAGWNLKPKEAIDQR